MVVREEICMNEFCLSFVAQGHRIPILNRFGLVINWPMILCRGIQVSLIGQVHLYQ